MMLLSSRTTIVGIAAVACLLGLIWKKNEEVVVSPIYYYVRLMFWGWTVGMAVLACMLGLIIWKKKDEGYMLIQWYPIENVPSCTTKKHDSTSSSTLVEISPWFVEEEKDEGRSSSNTATTATVIDVCDVFSETYWEARRKFRHAVHQLQEQQQQQQQQHSTSTTAAKTMLPTNVELY